jgi:protease secretion system membrane fusion protein
MMPTQPTQPPALNDDLEALADTSRLSRLAFWVLGVGFGGFMLWAAFVPLDEGVPTMGNVVIDTKRMPVQHPSGGTVAEIFVKEGDLVKAGQLLLRFGEGTAKANVEQAQSSLFALQENLKGQQAQVAGLGKLRPVRESQLALLQREYDGLVGLVAQGYAPVNQKLDMERRIADLRASLDEMATQEFRTKQAVLELGHQIRVAEERLALARKDLERTRIYASVDGQVVGLQVTNPGTVVQAAQKMMDLVPEKENLVIEAQIMPNLVDRIAVSDSVDIMFMTFSHSPQLVVEGKLDSISKDVLTDPKTAMPYYLARISVTPAGLELLGSRQMQPGMPVSVVVKTGSRTLLEYLVAPLTRRISQSMREE